MNIKSKVIIYIQLYPIHSIYQFICDYLYILNEYDLIIHMILFIHNVL
jgi:hypothetical protein